MTRAFLAGCFLSLCAATASAAERPNILFVYADDLGAWAARYAGHPQAHTPHLDRFRRQSAWLKNAFTTTPVCSPSRAGLFTSRYGTEVGVTDWINPKTEPELGLDPSWVTWPKLLAAAGYENALIGKYHLGVPAKFHPTRNGFSHFMGLLAGGTSSKNPTLEVAGEPRSLEGFTVDLVTDEALRFLKRPHEKPFCLCVHYREPHAPWLPTREEDQAPFAGVDISLPNPDFPALDTARLKKITPEYLASVASLDRSFGRLLAALDEQKLAERTLVVFTSDHGYNVGHHGVLHKGNGHWVLTQLPQGTANVPAVQRPNLFDDSLRVPCLVRWPGQVRPDSLIEHTVHNLDWFPTLLAAASVPLPAGLKIHGRDFLPLLRGAPPADWDQDLYAEYSTHHQSRTHMRGWRTPTWKLTLDFLNPGRDELYHLAQDPKETDNRIDAADPEAKRAKAELTAKILARMRALNDPALQLGKDPGKNLPLEPKK